MSGAICSLRFNGFPIVANWTDLSGPRGIDQISNSQTMNAPATLRLVITSLQYASFYRKNGGLWNGFTGGDIFTVANGDTIDFKFTSSFAAVAQTVSVYNNSLNNSLIDSFTVQFT